MQLANGGTGASRRSARLPLSRSERGLDSPAYSFGVLLYELLTGRTPFDPEELMRQGLDEIRRTIREQEPKKPWQHPGKEVASRSKR